MILLYDVLEPLTFSTPCPETDKLNKTERAKRMEAFKDEIPCFEDIHSIPFSSQTFEGVEELRQIVEDIADDNDVADE